MKYKNQIYDNIDNSNTKIFSFTLKQTLIVIE